MPNYFYDASALVKRYHTEQGSSIINPLFDGEARHFISELSVVEIHTAFSKKRLTKEITTDEALRRVRAQFSNDVKSRKIAVVQVSSIRYREAERLVRQYAAYFSVWLEILKLCHSVPRMRKPGYVLSYLPGKPMPI